jgi:hypothetical protein
MLKQIALFLEKRPLFILLLPLFIIVHVELQYGSLFTYNLVYRELLFIFIFPIALGFFIRLFLKHTIKAFTISFIISFFVFYLSQIKYYCMSQYPNAFISKYSSLLPLTALFILLSIYFIVKSKRDWTGFTKYLNIIFLIFILYDVMQMLLPSNSAKQNTTAKGFAVNCTNITKPNIYYIVLDGYSSSKELQKEFNFNNNAIEAYLTANGFKVITNAQSNYNITPYSIASTFNMDYIPAINKDVFLLKDYIKGVKEVYHTQLFETLQSVGYTIRNFSFFNFKTSARNAPKFDVFFMRHLLSEYNLFYQAYTDLDVHFMDWFWDSKKEDALFIEDKDAYNPALTNRLMSELQMPYKAPTFNYVHYYTPHTPYTRDSLGNKWANGITKKLSEKEQYIQQVMYTNKLIKETVQLIQQKDTANKVIILQADHGFRFELPEKYSEEFLNFSAIYFSNPKLLEQIPDDLNNVNTFRYINNVFFCTPMPILAPKQFALRYKTKNFH